MRFLLLEKHKCLKSIDFPNFTVIFRLSSVLSEVSNLIFALEKTVLWILLLLQKFVNTNVIRIARIFSTYNNAYTNTWILVFCDPKKT